MMSATRAGSTAGFIGDGSSSDLVLESPRLSKQNPPPAVDSPPPPLPWRSQRPELSSRNRADCPTGRTEPQYQTVLAHRGKLDDFCDQICRRTRLPCEVSRALAGRRYGQS